jgi:hypothetical protein
LRMVFLADDVFGSLRVEAPKTWWSQTGSNRRPHACKARALPAELWPRIHSKRSAPVFCALASFAGQASPLGWERAVPARLRRAKPAGRSVVGLGRLELPTSRLSSARSNQLSYKPLAQGAMACALAGKRRLQPHSAAPGACSSAKKEKRRRRNPANGAQQSRTVGP